MFRSIMKNRAIFYLLIALIITLSNVSVFLLPPEYTALNATANATAVQSVDMSKSTSFIIFFPLLAYMLMILLAIIYKRYGREKFVWGHYFIKGALLGFILITMIFLIELASGFLRIENAIPDTRIALAAWIISGIIFYGIVAFGEELPLRGYILPDLEKRYGLRNAVLLSSLLFSLLHIPSILILKTSAISTAIMLSTVMFAQMLLALCYLYDGLRMSIGFHFAWNFFQYHVYSLRGDIGGMLKVSSGYQLLTGGAMGPEAGLFGLFVVILALIIVFLWMRSSRVS